MMINSCGFGFAIEVTAKAATLKCAIYETPISYNGRTYEVGKKKAAWDGAAAVYYILRYNLLRSPKDSFYQISQLGSNDMPCQELPREAM